MNIASACVVPVPQGQPNDRILFSAVFGRVKTVVVLLQNPESMAWRLVSVTASGHVRVAEAPAPQCFRLSTVSVAVERDGRARVMVNEAVTAADTGNYDDNNTRYRWRQTWHWFQRKRCPKITAAPGECDACIDAVGAVTDTDGGSQLCGMLYAHNGHLVNPADSSDGEETSSDSGLDDEARYVWRSVMSRHVETRGHVTLGRAHNSHRLFLQIDFERAWLHRCVTEVCTAVAGILLLPSEPQWVGVMLFTGTTFQILNVTVTPAAAAPSSGVPYHERHIDDNPTVMCAVQYNACRCRAYECAECTTLARRLSPSESHRNSCE